MVLKQSKLLIVIDFAQFLDLAESRRATEHDVARSERVTSAALNALLLHNAADAADLPTSFNWPADTVFISFVRLVVAVLFYEIGFFKKYTIQAVGSSGATGSSTPPLSK